MTTTRTIALTGIDPGDMYGVNNTHIDLIESRFTASITGRGDTITISGETAELERLESFLQQVLHLILSGNRLSIDDITLLLELSETGATQHGNNPNIIVTTPKLTVKPKTPGQLFYSQTIVKNDITFSIGPAGTGKTFLAVCHAVAALLNDSVDRIILTRPAIEAGEKLGFLPGDLQNKVDPYLRPLYDSLFDLLPQEKVAQFMADRTIEVTPLGYMRGRSLNNAFIIMDEAQNTSASQMKMFLTRLGAGSKAIITGDITQIDLATGIESGLNSICNILNGVPDIGFSYLGKKDIVRHPLVQRIVMAYEKHEAKSPPIGSHRG